MLEDTRRDEENQVNDVKQKGDPELCYGGCCKWRTCSFILTPILILVSALAITCLVLLLIRPGDESTVPDAHEVYFYENFCDSYCASEQGTCSWATDATKKLDGTELSDITDTFTNSGKFYNKVSTDYIGRYCCKNAADDATKVCGSKVSENKALSTMAKNQFALPTTGDSAGAEKDLIFRIGEFMQEHDIKVWWSWNDADNKQDSPLLKYAPMMPKVNVWSSDKSYLGQYGLRTDIDAMKKRKENKDKNANEYVDYFATNPKEIIMATSFKDWGGDDWKDDDATVKDLKNYLKVAEVAAGDKFTEKSEYGQFIKTLKGLDESQEYQTEVKKLEEKLTKFNNAYKP